MKHNYYADYDLKTFFDIPELEKKLSEFSFNGELLDAAIFFRMNKERVKFDRPAFEFHPLLREAALLHSEQMIIHNFFNSNNPVNDNFKTLEDRFKYLKRKSKVSPNIKWVNQSILDYPIFDTKDTTIYDEFIFYDDEINHLLGGPPEEKIWTYYGFANRLVEIKMNAPYHGKEILNRDFMFFGSGLLMYKRWTRDDKFYFPSIKGTLYFGKI